MTDADMDRRLQAAGERWRATDHDLVPAPTSRRPWLLFASAAVVAAALVTGGVALFAGGDTTAPAPVGAPRIGTGTWQARSVLPAAHGGNRPADVDTPLPAQAFLRFHAGRVTGSDGCNSISGSATVHATTIDFGAVSSTEIACSAGVMMRALAVHRILTGTVQYSVTSTALVLSRSDAGTLFLSRPGKPVSPVGAWRLAATSTLRTNTDGSVGSGSSESAVGDVRLTLDNDGRLVVTLRCATLNGRVDTARARLSAVSTVDHTCAPLSGAGKTADEERFVIGVITLGAGYRVVDGDLRVTQGERSAVFTRTG